LVQGGNFNPGQKLLDKGIGLQEIEAGFLSLLIESRFPMLDSTKNAFSIPTTGNPHFAIAPKSLRHCIIKDGTGGAIDMPFIWAK
jgi:hypothetical protein